MQSSTVVLVVVLLILIRLGVKEGGVENMIFGSAFLSCRGMTAECCTEVYGTASSNNCLLCPGASQTG